MKKLIEECLCHSCKQVVEWKKINESLDLQDADSLHPFLTRKVLLQCPNCGNYYEFKMNYALEELNLEVNHKKVFTEFSGKTIVY